MSLLTPLDRLASPQQAAEQLESILLQRMLAKAKLFGQSNAPGAALRADLFAEALADAVTQAGGLGLAAAIVPQATGITQVHKKAGEGP